MNNPVDTIAVATDYAGSRGDPRDSLHNISKAGFTHLHWCHEWNSDHFYTDAELARLAGYLKSENLRLLDIHGSDGGAALCCWYSTDELYRRGGVDLVLNRMRMFAMLHGEGSLMMHIPSVNDGMTPERAEPVWKQVDALRRSLDELVPAAQALGVPFALENMPGDTFEVLEKMFAEYPADAVGLCYDSGHGNIRGADGAAHGLEHLENNLDRLMALHLHDNDGSGDQHRAPFYGNLDWHRLAEDIRRSAYPRMFSFELSMRNEEFAGKADFCRDAYERCVRAVNA